MFSLCPESPSAACGSMAGGMERCLASREGEHGKPSLQPTCVYFRWTAVFFLIFTSLSLLFPCDCAGFVLASSPSFLHITFSFCCGFMAFFFFLNLTFWFSSFSILFDKTHCMCLFLFVCFFYSFSFSSFFLFLSPKLFPFHSIGTREVVTQKNLSGLVPIRDLRLDPSLLCSLPLLALSPNLLIVWLFLSIAYLVAKLRCK